MEVLERRKIKFASPPFSAFAVNAIAVGHFAFAALLLGGALVSSTLEGSDIDKNLASTIGRIDSAEARNMQKTLERTAVIKDGLNRHMVSRLPSIAWVKPLNQTIDVALALLVAGAGACLLQRQPLAQTLSIAFASVCLVQKVITAGYQALAEIPVAKKYFEPLLRMYPGDAGLFESILAPISNAPVYQLLLAVYPVVVLAMVWQPGMAAALEPPRTPQRKPRPVLDTPTHAEPSTAYAPVHAVAPAPASVDPLEAMLQKKAF